ncbi:MAG TPA: nuclear transport factor 2 family protein, partial [Dongiaceae bacterium]
MSLNNKEVAKNLISAMASGDVETVKSLITKDFTAIATGTSKVAGTRYYQEIVDYIPGFKRISKEGIRLEFLNVTAEEDRVAVEAQGYCQLITGERYDQQYHFL